MKTITNMKWIKIILSWLMILIILSSFVTIVLFCFDFMKTWKWILLIIISVYMINISLNFHIFFSKKRTDKEKKCWIFINVFLIGIGPLLFIKYGYYAYYLNHDEQIKKLSNKFNELFNLNTLKTIDENLKLLSNYANKSSYSLLSNGHIQKVKNLNDSFALTIKLIRQAKKIILINFYILGKSNWFNAIANELLIKQKEGVKIFIEYDPFGSKKKLPKKIIEDLKLAGIEISLFKPQRSFIVTAIDNNRSHKKVLIIDGKIALYGGINISDEYLNFSNDYHYWVDEVFVIKGNIINELIRTYIIDWTIYGNNKTDLLEIIKSLNIINKSKDQSYDLCQLYDANPENNQNRMHHFYSLCFGLAKKKILINTPYLYLSEMMTDQLISLKRSGVDIKFLLPYHYDNKKFILEINAIQYQNLIDNGIEIYEIDAFNHKKSIIIDDMVLIGTTNLDQRALCLNYENVIFTKQKDLVRDLEQEFNQHLQKSIRIIKKIKKPIAFYYKFFVKLLMITETLL